jgi:hypothetical protein
MCSAKPWELDLRGSKAPGVNALLPGLCPSYQSRPIGQVFTPVQAHLMGELFAMANLEGNMLHSIKHVEPHEIFTVLLLCITKLMKT